MTTKVGTLDGAPLPSAIFFRRSESIFWRLLLRPLARENVGMERKLVAILAADVVGYSALMERDESGTHERLTVRRKELFEPEIARHHGRVFKTMGDGMLAEFGSVVDAVECAVSLQRGLAERNANLPEDQRLRVRIGINLGEVIVEGDDRFGEGVNIAARLEQLADPGGICVSGKVAWEVEKKLAFGFEPMGAQHVKNIAEPIEAFRVRFDGKPIPRVAPVAPKRAVSWVVVLVVAGLVAMLFTGVTWLVSRRWAPTESAATSGQPSLVVLPFANLSDSTEQGYLADGITEDLTTELANVPGLFVVSRNAAFSYKGKAVPPAQISKELGVRYILEGSTRRVADEMRIDAQLVDAQTGGYIWAQRFDGAWAGVFALQDKVVENVAGALKLRLTSEGKAHIAGGTSNPAAYEAFLRGLELELRNTPEDIAKAVTFYEQALALDPNFGRATAELAWVYWNATVSVTKALGFTGNPLDKLNQYLGEAAQHPSPTYYQLLAEQLVWRHKSGEAITALEKAIALDPSDAWSYEGMSSALSFNGRATDGRGYVDAAMRVDPGWTDWRRFLAGLAYFGMGHFEDAIASLEKIDPQSAGHWTNLYGLVLRLSADGHLGHGADIAVVREKLKQVLREDDQPELTGLMAQNDFPYQNYADTEQLLAGLRKAAVPELPFGFNPKSADRLSAPEIRSLFFGHEIRGREVVSGDPYWRKTEADGSYRATIGVKSFEGVSWIEGDILCIASRTRPFACRAVYRNPAGTFDRENQYFYFRDIDRFEFSVVK